MALSLITQSLGIYLDHTVFGPHKLQTGSWASGLTTSRRKTSHASKRGEQKSKAQYCAVESCTTIISLNF